MTDENIENLTLFDLPKLIQSLQASGFEDRQAKGYAEALHDVLVDLHGSCTGAKPSIDSQKYYRKMLDCGMTETQASGLASATYDALAEYRHI